MEFSEERAISVIESLARIEARLESGDVVIKEAKETKTRVDKHLAWHKGVRWALGIGGVVSGVIVKWLK